VPIATGTHLGQYQVQDFIGQGAMGLVYRAYHPELERTGAVKIMQAITPDADTVARFRHEAKAIAQLRHPNIVQVYDFGEYQGTPYMIVEYIPGGSLAQKMAAGRLDEATALRYLRGIAAGLDYAHRHGVVHRDVKPANVLLTAEDTPVLADFGLAKLLQGNSLKSMTGVTTGTPAYMAPEQVTGHNVGPAADRYSLATIAYEMLTGAIPFDGEGLMELLYAQVHREPPAPSWRNTALNARVDAVMMQGLAKDPAARWTSATAFIDALESGLAARRTAALERTMVLAPTADTATLPMAPTAVLERPATDVESTEDLTLAYPSPPPPQPRPKRRIGRRVMAAIAGAVLLLLIMGVCAYEVLPGTGLQVSPNPAARGELITITAARVPANQAGEIEFLSVIHTYSFQANSNGDVREQITVPSDVELGMHTVKLCWQDACHRSTQLRVVAGGVAFESPSPIGDTSPTPTVGVTPTPGVTPRPTSTPRSTATPRSTPTSTPRSGSSPTPTSRPTPKPSPTPTRVPSPSPSPSPTPTINPCPGNSNALALNPASQTVIGGNNASFTGSNFTPKTSVTVTYKVGTTSYTEPSVTVTCSGTISVSVKTKAGVARTDHIVVCDLIKSCITETVGILL